MKQATDEIKKLNTFVSDEQAATFSIHYKLDVVDGEFVEKSEPVVQLTPTKESDVVLTKQDLSNLLGLMCKADGVIAKEKAEAEVNKAARALKHAEWVADLYKKEAVEEADSYDDF